MSSRSSQSKAFSRALFSVLAATRWKQLQFAARLGISPRTFGRYLLGRASPPSARRIDFVHRLSDLPMPLLIEFATSLGISESLARSAHRAPPDGSHAAYMDASLLHAADAADVTPARARAIVERVLRTVVERGIDAETALGLVRRP